MDASDQAPAAHDAETCVAPLRAADAIALWNALDADRRARDERTERLRTMRLIGGDDEGA